MLLLKYFNDLKGDEKMSAIITPISDTTGRNRLADVIPLETPYSVYVYPTTYCNFKCVYCAHSLGTGGMKAEYDFKKEMMNLNTYKKTIGQLAQFPQKLKVLSLTGQGEPFLNKNIPEMIRIAKATGRFERIEIISNGALLTPKLADELVDAGLDILRISLQGVTAEKYEKMCGARIDFDTFLDNIRYFYLNRGKTKLFVKILDAALDNGEEELFYNFFEECSDRMFVERVQATYDGVEFTDNLEQSVDRYGREISKRKVCPLAFFMLGVYPNGDVQPCDTLYRPVILGNVHTDEILSMWNSTKLKQFWELQLENRRQENAGCSRCCAPNDVSHPEDVLDSDRLSILEKLRSLS